MHVDVLPVFLPMYYMHTWYPWSPEKDVKSFDIGVTDNC